MGDRGERCDNVLNLVTRFIRTVLEATKSTGVAVGVEV
jgi:hypothetical protein